jgi:hypothetical protein
MPAWKVVLAWPSIFGARDFLSWPPNDREIGRLANDRPPERLGTRPAAWRRLRGCFEWCSLHNRPVL